MVPYFTCVDLQCLNNSNPPALHLGMGEEDSLPQKPCKMVSCDYCEPWAVTHFVCCIREDLGARVCFCKTHHFSSKSMSEHGGSAYSSNTICKHPTCVFLTDLTLLFFKLKNFIIANAHTVKFTLKC